MSETVRVMLSEEEVDARISEMAAKISRDYEGKEVHLICVLKGAVFFTCELAKRLTIPVSLDFISAASYGGSTQSSGVVRITHDLDVPIAGKDVLLVEDVVDSGRTLTLLLNLMKERGAKSVRLCALLDKPERRIVDLKADYVGFTIPNEFVVGYGLDFDQRYRNLPYVGVIEFHE